MPKSYKNTSIIDLDFNDKALRCLRRGGVRILGDLYKLSELQMSRIDGLGEKTLGNIKYTLIEAGFPKLDGGRPDWNERRKLVSVQVLDDIYKENQEYRDKIDGLESDLLDAVDVAWRRGAHDWVRQNYPNEVNRLMGWDKHHAKD